MTIKVFEESTYGLIVLAATFYIFTAINSIITTMNSQSSSFLRIALIGLFFLCTNTLWAAKIDTLQVYSKSMNKEVPTVVLTPEAAENGQKFPVLYLLHGHGGHQYTWLKVRPDLGQMADDYGMIIVCPDGARDSWYWDSPMVEEYRYETFVSEELIAFVDGNYPSKPESQSRAIAGLSMGGHGALYLSMRHQDVFGAAGSMSGGVDIRPFPNAWNMKGRIGTLAEFPERWDDYSVMGNLHLLQGRKLKLIIDCGTEDFFYDVNEKLHQELLYRNIPHDYITRPGAHNGKYWANALEYQMLFFKSCFAGKGKK